MEEVKKKISIIWKEYFVRFHQIGKVHYSNIVKCILTNEFESGGGGGGGGGGGL